MLKSAVCLSMLFLTVFSVTSEHLQLPPPTISHKVPLDVEIPPSFSGNPINFFDDFSWKVFIALNWTAKAGVRGEADETKQVKDVLGLRVWESWKSDFETFPDDGTDPSNWTSFDARNPCSDIPKVGSGKERIIGSFVRFGDFNQASFGFLGNPLVAQNQTFTRYEIRVNQKEFEFIESNKLFLRKNLPQNQTPPGPALAFTDGSIEVKAAWKELLNAMEINAAKGKYYITEAKCPNRFNAMKAEKKTLALVGFHIVAKTPSRPQWIWASFEHKDNVPEKGAIPPPAAKFSYNDLTDPQVLTPSTAPLPLSATNPPPIPPALPTQMQVIRERDIHSETKKTNTLYQSKLAGTIWENYQLVLTQWPTKPAPATGAGDPFPGSGPGMDPEKSCIANSVMETYFQTSVSSSCMACHDMARTSKTDFVWFVQMRAFPPEDEDVILELTKSLEQLKPVEKQDARRLLGAKKKGRPN